MANLKQRINDDVKDAMRARDKTRLGTLRLISAALKQKEVDERIELDDSQILAVLDKMAKQLTLLAYIYDKKEKIIHLAALGSHENFYRNLKRVK